MKPSFKRIDYSLRPAKHAERRMLTDIFRRLRPFAPLESYRYIGLGSLWFSDFTLFHRTLGIRDMLSIERNRANKDRFVANKPFAAIAVDFRESSTVLPELDWSKPAFVWLDYDDPLSRNMLFDAGVVATRAVSGTVLAVTLQCQQAKEVEESSDEPAGPEPIVRFRENIGPEAVPNDAGEDDLSGWPFGALSRRIIAHQIEASLASRNLGSTAQDRISYTHVCDIEYMDGARMTTSVGVFSKHSDQSLLAACELDRLDFLMPGSNRIRIEVPVLTMREIRELEQQLPLQGTVLSCGSIPSGHANKFAQFYRYLPNFAVLEH